LQVELPEDLDATFEEVALAEARAWGLDGDVPVVLDLGLGRADLTFSGPAERVQDLLRSVLVQVAAFNGPAEVAVAVAAAEPGEWAWLAALAHARGADHGELVSPLEDLNAFWRRLEAEASAGRRVIAAIVRGPAGGGSGGAGPVSPPDATLLGVPPGNERRDPVADAYVQIDEHSGGGSFLDVAGAVPLSFFPSALALRQAPGGGNGSP
jgi:hypothetical protein